MDNEKDFEEKTSAEMEELINQYFKEDFDELEEYEKELALKENLSNEKKVSKGFLKELYEWTQAIAIAVVLALFINQFVFSIVEVQGASMEPTLNNSERLFVFKSFYEPKNKDIIIIKSEQLGKYIVKRVIAVGGQTVDIDKETGEVYVNGKLQNETYVNEGTNYYVGNTQEYPLTVPEGHVFVMGDNRGNSMDSRALGVLENEDIMGKAIFRIWPISSFGGLYDNLK